MKINLLALSLIFLPLVLLSLPGCRQTQERPYEDSIMGIRYGVIEQTGAGSFIMAIENGDKMAPDTLAQFLHCLRERVDKQGSTTMYIKIFKYFYYIDQLKDEEYIYRCEINQNNRSKLRLIRQDHQQRTVWDSMFTVRLECPE